MSDSELNLKAAPPRTPRTVLERDRLVRFWSDVRERTALLVTAPAGFGKTTLLLQWRARWLDEGAIVAWFSVDDTDDPARFAAGLMHAVHLAGSPPNGGAEQTAGRSGIEMLTGLLADIALSERTTVLMLDDAERLPEATLASVQYLLLNAPVNLHVVVGSRVPLSLQTSDLLAKGNLATLTTEQLRFRLEESMAILERQLGARLTADERALLHDATEGWPIGLQLAVAEIEHVPDPAGAIRVLSARHGSLQDYFNESLVKRIPADIVEMLTRVAILENINAELFALVTGHEVSEDALQRFMRETPILMIGEHREWARLHPLARDFFLSRFEQLPVAERAELHAQVSRWYRDHDNLHEAANHALAAGNEALAQDYAARSLWALGTWGMVEEAREWVERIPPKCSHATWACG